MQQTRAHVPVAPLATPARIRATLRAVPIWAWVWALTGLAAALRVYHLGAESFWFDEADILSQARAPLSDVLAGFLHAGENGPLYTLLLWAWVRLVGSGEAAVRLLPLGFGVATIPVIYVLGKRLVSAPLGLLAAALLAVSPFHIWHSQDAKMYTLVVLLTLGSMTLYLQALARNTTRWWAAYVLATWMALVSHSMAVLILGAQLLATPLLWPQAAPAGERASRRRHWAWALAVLAVPFLPIAALRAAAFVGDNLNVNWHGVVAPVEMLRVLFVKFALNEAPPPWEAIGAGLAGALFALGAWPWPGDKQRTWAAVALLWALPIAGLYALSLKVPLFEPRYLIIVLPFYLLFVAMGLLRLGRRAPAVAVAVGISLLGLQGLALATVNYSAAPQKEEWRQALDYVRQHVRGRDVIIVHPGYLATAVEQYYAPSGDVPVVPVVPVPYLNTAGFGPRQLADSLDKAIIDHERAWVITSPGRTEHDDPQGDVLGFFEGRSYPYARYYQFDVQHFIGVTVTGYAFNGQPHSWFPQPVYPQPVAYPGGFQFQGSIYEMRGPQEDVLPPATWLPVTLYWRFATPPTPAQDYIISLRLWDTQGKEWAAYDQAPLNGLRPTLTFPAAQTIIDYADLFVPGNAPPGIYHLTLQVWPRCQTGVCWDAAQPRSHAGAPLAPPLTLVHPITVRP
ncbi:MAG: glycosyltransferase family 39 protein [Chloroflexota bacterium]|nr:glycosyltransferase family 39 protein [Chloroflexota bacterium]